MLYLLVTGSVGYGHVDFVTQVLGDLLFGHDEVRLISPNRWDTPARTATAWARERQVRTMVLVPDFDTYGSSAAFRRDTRMVSELTMRGGRADTLVVCFWDGVSEDCTTQVHLAVGAGHEVLVYDLAGQLYPEPTEWALLRAANSESDQSAADETEAESA